MIEALYSLAGLMLKIIGIMTVLSALFFIALMWADGKGRDK